MNDMSINDLKQALIKYSVDKEISAHNLDKDCKVEISENFDKEMCAKITSLIESKRGKKEKLSNVNNMNTLGEYVKTSRQFEALSRGLLAKTVNYDAEKLEAFEQDEVLPFEVPINTFVAIFKKLKLKLEWVEVLFRKSCRLLIIDDGTADLAFARSRHYIEDVKNALGNGNDLYWSPAIRETPKGTLRGNG